MITKTKPAVSSRAVLTASILASSMAFIDGSALNVALPALQQDLQASGADLLWIVDGYLLMLASLILVSGSIGDLIGRKRVFMIGILVFSAASVACGLAPTPEALIWARVAQGLGGALMVPGSLALISALLPFESQGRAIGTWSAASAMVTAAGPLLGGFLADIGLWRLIFLINVPLGAIALFILWTRVPESRVEGGAKTVDIPGAISVTIGLAGLTYGFITMSEHGATDLTVILALAAGVAALAAFVWIQLHSTHPMVPFELFRSRTFLGANLLTFLLYGALNLLSFFLSLNIVQVQGFSPTVAGFAFLPFVVLMIVLSRWAGSLADRIGPRWPLIAGPLIVAAGYLWIAFAGLTTSLPDAMLTFIPPISLFGVGMAITVAPLTTAVMTAVPSEYAGTASGINNAISRTAGVLAIAIVGALAISLFRSQLAELALPLPLDPASQQALLANANQLAETSIPAGVPAALIPAVEEAIKYAFVHMHAVVMGICTALAMLSSLVAFLFIEPKPKRPQKL